MYIHTRVKPPQSYSADRARRQCEKHHAALHAPMGIHYRGLQWEGGAADWGSFIS